MLQKTALLAALLLSLPLSAQLSAQTPAAITAEGNDRILTAHMATDHSYSDKRIELETQVIRGLEALPEQ